MSVTATCPVYGSPLASADISLASRVMFPCPPEDFLNIPIAASVAGPAIPSTFNPFFR